MFKLLYLKEKKGEAIMDGITQNNDTQTYTHTHTQPVKVSLKIPKNKFGKITKNRLCKEDISKCEKIRGSPHYWWR